MLYLGRISAFLTIDTTSLYVSKKLGIYDNLSFPGFQVDKLEASFQASKASKRLKGFSYSDLEIAILHLRKKGIFQKIMTKYLGAEYLNLSSVN